jgi:hypothetical protein
MTDDLITTEVEDQQLVALTPAEMPAAQHALTEWCAMKVQALRQELRDLEENQQIGVEAGMKTSRWNASIARTERRIVYYDKLKAAVEAGYLIVPNFPINIFAVRVKRARQPQKAHEHKWGGFRAEAQLLPAGEGRYVDEQVKFLDMSHKTMKDGKEVFVEQYLTDDYDAVDFPVTLVKPSVVARTQVAMTARIFDQIGLVASAGTDPIVVGRLLDPRGGGRCTTFFIAWWLDTRTL